MCVQFQSANIVLCWPGLPEDPGCHGQQSQACVCLKHWCVDHLTECFNSLCVRVFVRSVQEYLLSFGGSAKTFVSVCGLVDLVTVAMILQESDWGRTTRGGCVHFCRGLLQCSFS